MLLTISIIYNIFRCCMLKDIADEMIPVPSGM